jgi:GH43 family beta-xylosidase
MTSYGAGTYVNPLGVSIADPVVIYDSGVYYLYGTTSTADGFIVHTSPDLVHWEDRGFAFKKTDQSWGRDHFWAPSIVKRYGFFYLFYSAIGSVGGHVSHRICVARSDNPLGPFIDVKAPFLTGVTATIDPHVLIDGDDAYIYYSLDVSENRVSKLYVSRLSEDLLSTVGERTLCVEPSGGWEGDIWNEAPYVIKVGNKFVLMYSARGYFDPLYAVGYAVSDSPMGPWQKATNNPILSKTEKVCGPGHNCIVASPDGTETFIVYHVHKTLVYGGERQLAMDRIEIKEEDGTVKIKVAGPTCTPQPIPR